MKGKKAVGYSGLGCRTGRKAVGCRLLDYRPNIQTVDSRGLGCRYSGTTAYRLPPYRLSPSPPTCSLQPNSLQPLSSSAFTLIEVLLAALIMGFGLSVLLVGTSRCLHAMKTAQQYQTAEWIMGLGEAEHPFLTTNDVEALNVSPKTYDKGFVFERKVDDDEDKDGLYLVHSKVTWPDGANKGTEETLRYVYRPKEEGK